MSREDWPDNPTHAALQEETAPSLEAWRIQQTEIQDKAEQFWRRRLPGLSKTLVTRMACSFGCSLEAHATDHRRKLLREVSDYGASIGMFEFTYMNDKQRLVVGTWG
jgi:hypothetical protein